MRRLLIVAVGLRVVAALLLVAGPWTNEPAELAGWDVARFQEIVEEPGRHWVDHEVEYPPGTVLILETIAQDGVVETHRILVALSLAIDLGIAGVLATLRGRTGAGLYLLLGLPLVPMGLVRLDLWAVILAVVAAGALVQRKSGAFAVTATAAAVVKVWPALLVAAALAARRSTAAMASVAVMAAVGIGWLVYGGFSIDPISQVLSLRGATGWHVESIGGNLTALLTDEQPRQQLDAFRIGELDTTLVTLGRLLTIAIVAGLAVLGRRALRSAEGTEPDETRVLDVVALVMLGATAALIATAPLVSPQFLLWLTPWAALVSLSPARFPVPLALTAVATLTTGIVLAVYGPPRLAETTPAAILLARNVGLVAIAAAAALALWSSGRAEDPLGDGGAGPGPAGS